jgi:hypothetical protein
MSAPHSASSGRHLLSRNNVSPMPNGNEYSNYGALLRDPTTISTNDIGLPKVLGQNTDVGEETLYQVDIENEGLLRQTQRSELASKNALLTRRWQTSLVSSLVLLVLAGGIGK